MKKIFIFLAFLSLMTLEAKAQNIRKEPTLRGDRLNNRGAPDGSFQIDSYPLLQSLEINAALNYQILSLPALPSFSDPGILLTPMKWNCDPGILLSSKYINCDPKMIVPFDENKYEKEIHFDESLLPNSFFSPYVLPGTNPFMNKLELLPPEKLHIPDFRLFDLMTK